MSDVRALAVSQANAIYNDDASSIAVREDEYDELIVGDRGSTAYTFGRRLLQRNVPESDLHIGHGVRFALGNLQHSAQSTNTHPDFKLARDNISFACAKSMLMSVPFCVSCLHHVHGCCRPSATRWQFVYFSLMSVVICCRAEPHLTSAGLDVSTSANEMCFPLCYFFITQYVFNL